MPRSVEMVGLALICWAYYGQVLSKEEKLKRQLQLSNSEVVRSNSMYACVYKLFN
jgi:hypothetical protein